MNTLRSLSLFAVAGCLGWLAGCGGGSQQTTSAATSHRGAIRFTIAWPATTTRLIPVGTRSVSIQVLDAAQKVVAQQTLTRAEGESSKTVTLDVPEGDLQEIVNAYPNSATDATPGTALASATVAVHVNSGQTVSNTVTLQSTITHVQVAPTSASITVGGTGVVFTATALDAQGQVVATGPNVIDWSVDDATKATLTKSGATATVVGTQAGTVKLTAHDTETNLASTPVVITIAAAASGTGDPHIIVGDSVNHRVIGVDDITGKNFTVLTASFYGVQDSVFDSAGRIYVADYPLRLVRFDNIRGANPIVYKPSSPAGYLHVDTSGHIYYRDDMGTINRIDDLSGTNHVSFGGFTLFGGPQGIDTDSQNHIYVADSVNNRVYRFDDMTGANPKLFGSDGTLHLDLGGVNGGVGHDLAVDIAGRVYLADFNNHRIVRLDPAAFDDPSKANPATFAVAANAAGNAFKPLAVAVDKGTAIHIYFTGIYQDATGNTTDAAVFRMDDMTGTNLTRLGTFGSGNGQFSYPVSISVR
jgi:streptogramin lyase